MAFWRPWVTSDKEEDSKDMTQPEFAHKDLHVQTQRIILNMYSCLLAESGDNSSKNMIVQRIIELTKLSRSTIMRVINNGDIIDHSSKRKEVKKKLRKIDMGTKEDIRRIVYDFYRNNTVPTLAMIREKLQEFPDFGYKSLDTLRNILLDCGFKYKKLDKRMVIMESPRLVKHRQDYLRKIKEYRDAGREIVYLDETWFDTHDVVQYGWMDDSKKCNLSGPCSRGKRIIILHAGSKDGFIPNALLLSAKNIKQSSADYHEDMTAELFEKWAEEQLCPNLKPNSVIVMDNASYHSRIKPDTKVPTTSTKKADIVRFMESKGMEVPMKATKKILLEMVKAKNFKNEYFVDNFFESHGHTVLRLPPYYCVLNPIEMVWAATKKQLRKINQTPEISESVIDNIRTIMAQLDETDLWRNCVSHVETKENEYSVLPPVNPLVINVNGESSSEDSDSDNENF